MVNREAERGEKLRLEAVGSLWDTLRWVVKRLKPELEVDSSDCCEEVGGREERTGKGQRRG